MPQGPSLIIVLFLVGFLLVAAEVFLPGITLGILGFFCLAGSVALVFAQYGFASGIVAAFVVAFLSIGGFIIWLAIFPRTFIGRRIVLDRKQSSAAPVHQGLEGHTGTALTPLRPAGTARIGDRRVDVTATGEFLEEGAEVVVVASDGMRVVVRRKDRLETAPSDA